MVIETDKQKRVIENKQRRFPLFLLLLNCVQTAAMLGRPANIRNCTNHPGLRESFNPFPLLSFLRNIPPPPFCWPLVLLSSSSCQYRPKASDIVLAKSLLFSAVLPPCSSVALCDPALCATKKSGKKEAALPSTDPDPQKVSICPSYAFLLSPPSPSCPAPA